MATSVSSVTIANRALQRLSATAISALSQTIPNAQNCNTAYDPLRRMLLRRYPWSFAIARASVAMDSNQTAWGNHNRYLLPNDFIRLIRPGGQDTDSRTDWRIEGQYIITNDGSPLQFRYIFDNTDPTTFDPLFCEALSCLMAHEICLAVTGSQERKQGLAADLKDIIAQAKKADSFERDAQEPLLDDWIIAMY